MKRLKLLTAVCVMACVLAACGSDEPENTIQTIEAEPIETPAPTSSEEPEPTAEPEPEHVADTTIIQERVEVNGQMQSYLTGEWKDVNVVNRRPMAVMMPNNKAALPQYGISQASIIFEAPVEGRITRLLAIYEDYDELDHIGPVRSARDYYIYEAMAYDAIFCNWGLAVPFCEEVLASDKIDNVSQAVSGIHNPSSEAFDRINRGSGYAQEYTGYMFMDGYERAVQRHGYQTTYRDTFEQAFTFANDGHRAEYSEAQDVTMIYPGGKSGSNSSGYGQANPWFEYNAEDGLYYRYEYSAKQVDEMNGEQLTFSNVIFKVVEGAVHEPTSYDYLWFQVEGGGDAYIFTNGKMIRGTWSRSGDRNANIFYDQNGNEIIFNQGKTWICEIWDEYENCIEYE